MAATFRFEIKGLQELVEGLRRLPDQLAKRTFVRATRAGAMAMVRAAKAAAPVRADPRPKPIKPRVTRAGRRTAEKVMERLRRAGGKAVRVSRREARVLLRDAGGATRGPGYLRDQIRLNSVRARGGVVVARIGMGAAFYGQLLERGFFNKRARRMIRRPFFNAAVLGARQAAVQAVADALRAGLDDAIRKAKAGGPRHP